MFAVLAGFCVLAIDYFTLKAYGSGLAVSVVGSIIIGESIAIAALIGFLRGKAITLIKVIGVLLVITDSIILAAVSG